MPFNRNNNRRNNFSRGGGRGGNARGGSRGGDSRMMYRGIDISKFIKKAEPIEQTIYTPKFSFTDFNFEPALAQNVAKKGYINPGPIQDSAIPAMMLGKDVVGIANTGTGKTAAFLLPMINKIILDPKETLLVITPTRELAIQIYKELEELTRGISIFGTVCVGGAPMMRQIESLRRGCHVVIGTPGRLMDLGHRGVLDFSCVTNVVLDEADKMLDMGFIDDITQILEVMPEERQTLLFSATFPKNIQSLASRITKDPEVIKVATQDTSKNIEQQVIYSSEFGSRFETLEHLLAREEVTKVIVFAGMKHIVHELAEKLSEKGHKAVSLHGDKRHNERQRTLDLFKKDHATILVATDVAARGLDIKDVTHVINYEIPESYDTYIHRIGRTGRASQMGSAFTIL